MSAEKNGERKFPEPSTSVKEPIPLGDYSSIDGAIRKIQTLIQADPLVLNTDNTEESAHVSFTVPEGSTDKNSKVSIVLRIDEKRHIVKINGDGGFSEKNPLEKILHELDDAIKMHLQPEILLIRAYRLARANTDLLALIRTRNPENSVKTAQEMLTGMQESLRKKN